MYRLLFSLFLVLFAVGAYRISSTPPSSQAVAPVRYENAQYGIVFTYPSSYELQERDVEDGRHHHTIVLVDKEALASTSAGGEGPPVISIDVFKNNFDTQSLTTWIRNSSNSNYKLGTDGYLATTTLAGEKAFSYTWEGLYRGESMALAHNDNTILCSVMFDSLGDKIRQDFYTMLSTLSLY